MLTDYVKVQASTCQLYHKTSHFWKYEQGVCPLLKMIHSLPANMVGEAGAVFGGAGGGNGAGWEDGEAEGGGRGFCTFFVSLCGYPLVGHLMFNCYMLAAVRDRMITS